MGSKWKSTFCLACNLLQSEAALGEEGIFLQEHSACGDHYEPTLSLLITKKQQQILLS